MPNWNEVLKELDEVGRGVDVVRRRYLKKLHRHTKRNVILYYSGWLQRPEAGVSISDDDMNGFMAVVHGLDRSKGLDLLLHTPGGDLAAVESIGGYLREMFDDIRVVVPQLAFSGGTLLALAGHRILMGKHSSLGPFDPQLGGLPAQGLLRALDRARNDISVNPNLANFWLPFLQQLPITLEDDARHANQWSQNIVEAWLRHGMFANLDEAERARRIGTVIDTLGSQELTKAHNRHVNASAIEIVGLNLERLEDDNKLQDLVLTVHHTCMHTLKSSPTWKLIENHAGVAVASGPPEHP